MDAPILYDGEVEEQVPQLQLQLEDIESFLRQESQKRFIDRSQRLSLFECLAQAIDYSSKQLPRGDVLSDSLNCLKNPEEIRNSVCDLLSKHSKQFQSVIFLHADNVPSSDNQTENKIKEFYQTVISNIKHQRKLHQYTELLLYAAATCINSPIYVICRNEFSRSRWSYFQPLFTYDGQPVSVLEYVTMAMTSGTFFYNVKSREVSILKPYASGLIGMYIEDLEDISPLDIDVPDELLALSNDQKSRLCRTVSRDIILRSCILFLKRGYIQRNEFDRMTAHQEEQAPVKEFRRVVSISTDAFRIVCQILIQRQDKTVLTKFVRNWDNFVTSCDYLQRLASLAVLDEAIHQRNVCVSTFVQNCQLGEQELDERRKKVTTTVIASSSVGIVSGGLVIAGLVLAPVSFGASLGLSIAGGVIGVGSGVAAGTTRTFETVKQKSKIKYIRAELASMKKEEINVLNALKKTELLFNQHFRESQDVEDIGIGLRDFYPVGTALRASNSITHIVLSAARLSATAATAAAAVLGPLSLVVDIAFLAEALNNKATGDKTNAGETLQTIAKSIETKSKIFNNMLRGSWKETARMQ